MNEPRFLDMATRECDECKQVRLCTWTPTGPFRGVWRCYQCKHLDDKALADSVKAAHRKLETQK